MVTDNIYNVPIFPYASAQQIFLSHVVNNRTVQRNVPVMYNCRHKQIAVFFSKQNRGSASANFSLLIGWIKNIDTTRKNINSWRALLIQGWLGELKSELYFRALALPPPKNISGRVAHIEQLEELQALTPQWQVPVAPIISLQP